jgi:glycosyltransferase involved in cell wall biosynthesis
MTSAPVSVIIPCYNTERYLAAALDSVCSQMPAPAEVLVIDAGSTDGSAAIAEAFGGPVRCHRREHLHAAAARNAGMAIACEAFVAFLDADDLWTTDSLLWRLDALHGNAAAGYASGLVEQFVSPDVPEDLRATFVCPEEPSRGRGPGSLLVRREVMARVGGFDERLRVGEGIDWIDRANAAGVIDHAVDRVVFRRRIHGQNTGAQHREFRVDYPRLLKMALDRRRAAAKAADAALGTHANDG